MVSDYQSRAQESRNKFDYSKSSSIVRNSHLITLDYYDQTIKGQEASDILTLGDKTLSRINFLILSASGKFRFEDGFIGLGYTPRKEEKKFSIIQQLFENGNIPHKVFTQKYTDNYNGHITFGEIPKYIVDDYKHYGRCKALNKIRKKKEYKNNNWECFLDYMYSGEENKTSQNSIADFTNDDNKQKVLFLSYRKRSFLPYKLFELFGKTYLKKAIDDNYLDSIEFACGRYDAIEDCDALILITEWREFRNPHFKIISEKLKQNVIFDGRNIYNKKIEELGFELFQIGC
jgi:hypothetical protein